MSHADILGVFFPLTMESNINVDAPFFLLPAAMVHELAHQSGFIREDEANFISYLACKQSDEPIFLYSGLFLAFRYSIFALKEVNPEFSSEVMSSLSHAVLRDIAQNEQYLTQYKGIISNVSNTINDTYLKANNQSDGVNSYGRIVDLLLAEQRAAVSQPVAPSPL
jgi:hypothetical protein